MSSANVEGMLREGVNALKLGRKDEARALLLRAVELDQYNEEAWLWLSGVLDSLDDQRTALENVLAINPGNDRARQGLDYVNKQLGISAPPSPSGLATSVEWGAPAGSPPNLYAPPPSEPTSDVLDNWVNTLNIPTAPPGSKAPPSEPVPTKSQAPSIAAPFGDLDLEDDLFAAGPFKADQDEMQRGGRGSAIATAGTGRDAFDAPPDRRSRRERRAAQPRPTTPPPVSASDQTQFQPMFPGIPLDLPATRLPGTVENTPVLISLGIVLLVLANIGLAVWFMIGFFA